MIASLRGKIIEKQVNFVVLETTNGVGYGIYLSPVEAATLKIDQTVTLLISEHIRDDAYSLYGFTTAEAKQLFERLLDVSGVGPKVALTILSAASVVKIKEAIESGDADIFKAVAGVGQKTAQRIIVDLRGKLESPAGQSESADPAYQALVGLGYSPAQAAKAATSVPAEITGDQDRIKAALKELSH